MSKIQLLQHILATVGQAFFSSGYIVRQIPGGFALYDVHAPVVGGNDISVALQFESESLKSWLIRDNICYWIYEPNWEESVTTPTDEVGDPLTTEDLNSAPVLRLKAVDLILRSFVSSTVIKVEEKGNR